MQKFKFFFVNKSNQVLFEGTSRFFNNSVHVNKLRAFTSLDIPLEFTIDEVRSFDIFPIKKMEKCKPNKFIKLLELPDLMSSKFLAIKCFDDKTSLEIEALRNKVVETNKAFEENERALEAVAWVYLDKRKELAILRQSLHESVREFETTGKLKLD